MEIDEPIFFRGVAQPQTRYCWPVLPGVWGNHTKDCHGLPIKIDTHKADHGGVKLHAEPSLVHVFCGSSAPWRKNNKRNVWAWDLHVT